MDIFLVAIPSAYLEAVATTSRQPLPLPLPKPCSRQTGSDKKRVHNREIYRKRTYDRSCLLASWFSPSRDICKFVFTPAFSDAMQRNSQICYSHFLVLWLQGVVLRRQMPHSLSIRPLLILLSSLSLSHFARIHSQELLCCLATWVEVV